MDPQPMGKFLGICVLAAVGGLAGGLQLAQGPAAVAGVPRPAQGLALLPQRITFDPPRDAVVGQPVRLSASTDADAHANLVVSFRSESPTVCTVAGSRVTTITVGPCDITAFQGGSAVYAAAQASGSFQVIAHEVRSAQRIVFGPMPGTTVGVPVVLTASSRTVVTKGEDSPTGLPVSYTSQNQRVCDIAQSFDVAPATSGFPGALTILLAAVVFAAAGATSVVRRVRRRSHRPPEPQPTVRADPVPGPPALVSVQNTGAGVRHTVRIESSPGASITRIKEGKS